jgi:hypothetical protein
MQRELQNYYENRFTMMTTKGWKDLMEDLDMMIASTDRVAGIEDAKQLHFKQGELSILKWLKYLRESSAEVYEQLQESVDETTV